METAGWSACFLSAIKLVAGKKRTSLPADVAIDAEIDPETTHGVFGVAARLAYPHATRGNIDVTIKVV